MAITAFELLKSISSATLAIYNQVQLVKANKSQCQRLCNRVKIVTETIAGLEKLESIEHFQAALLEVDKLLKECLKFITEFSDEKSWWKKLIKAGTHKERFESLTKQLLDAILPLNLGINAQQAFHHELDLIDQKEDLEAISKQQDLILKLSQEHQEQLNKIELQHEIQNKFLVDRIASLRIHIDQLHLDQLQHEQPQQDKVFKTPTLSLKTTEPQGIKGFTAEEYYTAGQEFYSKGDYGKARFSYKKASELGHIKATTNLGYLYLKAKGVEKDLKLAYDCFHQSAKNGHPRAMFNLAHLYESNKVTSICKSEIVDFKAAALKWYESAAALGDEQAKEKAKNLRQKSGKT